MSKKENQITEIEYKQLDENQIKCVNHSKGNILAIAGAGCGKTTTILARVKYLLEIEKVKSSEILILSFTNSSCLELSKRLEAITNENINVCTFHKLGKDIIFDAENKDMSLAKESISEFVDKYISYKLKSNSYFEFYDFIINYFHEYIPFTHFITRKESNRYLQNKGIVSLDNEYKLTFEENLIANYLYLNNIEYEYFENNPFKDEFNKLISGFYLPKYDKYIFNLYINKLGDKPLWGYPKIKKIAYKNYDAYIKYLKNSEFFKDKSIFTYSYELEDGTFKDTLEEKLKAENIDIMFSYSNIGKEVKKLFRYNIVFIKKLISNFITLMKTTARNSQDVLKINNYDSLPEELRAKSFYRVVLPIYEAYQNMLKQTNQIDFNDMIIKAKNYIESSNFIKDYKHILIDEFQDISYSRMELIDKIYKHNHAKIFAVGDDYQSIFGFTGSDINIFYDFEKDYNATTFLIEQNYRFDKTIAQVTNKFIQKNPYQIKKNIQSNKVNLLPINIIKAPNKNKLCNMFLKTILSMPKDSEIMLLGRYKRDIIPYVQTNLVNVVINENNQISVIIEKRKDLKIRFMTVHKSKGLESDYVFILNTFKHIMGFPCNITDDKLIKILLKNKENYPHSEERRLFYVALTRARKKIFLMVNESSMSNFVKEIMEYKTDTYLNK